MTVKVKPVSMAYAREYYRPSNTVESIDKKQKDTSERKDDFVTRFKKELTTAR